MEGSSMLEHIMGYFGTYTPAADGAIATFQFEYLTTLGFRSHRYLLRTRDCRSQRPAQKNMRYRLRLSPVSSFLLLYLSSRVPESSVFL